VAIKGPARRASAWPVPLAVDIFAAHYACPVMAVYERTGPIGIFPGQLWSVG